MNGDDEARIKSRFLSKKYRDSYANEHTKTVLAHQIRSMREDCGWSQEDLAIQSGTSQSGISRIENPDYGNFSLKSLKRLASIFDVALLVRFVPFSEIAKRADEMSESSLTVPTFDDDQKFSKTSTPSSNVVPIFKDIKFGSLKTTSSSYVVRPKNNEPLPTSIISSDSRND